MKKILKNKKGILCVLFAVLLFCIATAPVSFASEDDFETKIAAFPESYKPYLRQMHKAHPSWEFEPFFTYLDFNDVVDNQCGNKSLISSSSASTVFKSKDIGDYNYSKDYYIQKDGGFVEANRFAVAYFIDPRNFLNEDGIFMFETLSFSESFTIESVENVLKGSFMENKKITYYNSKGKKKTTKVKYSEAILEAGKKYNVNPCYLASKILNEVGTTGSSSVSGKHSTYPGIYNFYNIGAYDGANAIAKGLKWASEGNTYSRPWTTPVKSINGGAEFLASSYIACGQFTGYLQRFNVNPNGQYKVYDHQYMTNLTGALSQGYSSYVSYVKSGLIDNKYVFSIPVYENMPSWSTTEGDLQLVDGLEQKGVISASASFVRSGPSTNYSQKKDVEDKIIKLTKGEPVKIIEKVKTDSNYFLSVLQYPYWYKVSFVLKDVEYEGYIPLTFIDITTDVTVSTGEYTPPLITTNEEMEMHLVSYDAQIAEITPENKINFLKEGTVIIGAYDSLGNFDRVKYVVSKEESIVPAKTKIKSIKADSLSVNFTPSSETKEYEVIGVDGKGSVVHRAVTSKSTHTVKINNCVPNKFTVTKFKKNSGGSVTAYWNAPSRTDNTVFVRAVIKDTEAEKIYGPAVSIDASSFIKGFEVFSYDSESDAYTKIKSLGAEKTQYNIPAQKYKQGKFALRALVDAAGTTVKGKYTEFDIKTFPKKTKGMSLTDVTDKSYLLKWNESAGAEYIIYKYDGKKYKKYKTVSKAKYNPKNLSSSAYTKLKVSAFKEVNGIVYEGVSSKAFSVTTLPSAVKNLKVTTSSEGGKLEWKKIKGVTLYDIYIYSSKDKKFKKIGSTKTNSYTLKGKDAGKAYTLRVNPVIKTTYGTFTHSGTKIKFRTKPEKVTELKTSAVKTTSFTLNWNKTKGTDRYYVYRYSASKKKYVKIATVKTNKYTHKELTPGKTYKYKIKSVRRIDGKDASVNTSSVFKVTTLPDKVKEVKTSAVAKETLTLSWKSVSGAGSYQIYKYDKKKDKYVSVATVKGKTTYKVKNLSSGTSYKFKIKAVKTLGSKKYYSSFSDIFTFKTKK